MHLEIALRDALTDPDTFYEDHLTYLLAELDHVLQRILG